MTKPIDLRDANPGDQLLSCHGEVLTYERHDPYNHFPHTVRYANGGLGTRTDDGYVITNPIHRLPTDHNIVEIIPATEYKFYFVKTTGELIKTAFLEPSCEVWSTKRQRWEEESNSHLHRLMELGCVMELSPPYQGVIDESDL